MPDESVNAEGRTVLVLDHDEAAVVCGPDNFTLYLHQDANGPVESAQNLAAAAMVQMYGDLEPGTDVPFGGTNGPAN